MLLNKEEIKKIGFKSVGEGVMISDKASFYGADNISIGSHTRIDDFCVLSAGDRGMKIGRNVHLSVGVSIVGRGKVEIGDFCALSVKVSVFSTNDDYSGKFMINPTVDPKYTNITYGEVSVGKHVVVGSNSVILPDVKIGDGVAVGALSLVKSDCESFWVYGGVPAVKIKERSRDLLKFEKELLSEEN